MRTFSRQTLSACLGLALAGGAWARPRSERVVVTPPSPTAVANWCQLGSLPPVPAPKGERAVVRVPAENPGIKDEVSKLGISVSAEYADALVVRAKPGELRDLQRRGVTVQQEPAGDVVIYRGVYFDTAPGSTSPRGAPPPSAWLMRVGPADRLPWLVQFVGPVTSDWMTAISTAGGEVLESSIPNNALVARLTAAQADILRRLPFVQWLNPVEPLHKIDPGLAGLPCPVPASESIRLTQAARSGSGGQRVLVQILLFGADPEAANAVASEVESRKGKVRRELPTARAVVAELPPGSFPAIAALPNVSAVERFTPSLGLTSGVRMNDGR